MSRVQPPNQANRYLRSVGRDLVDVLSVTGRSNGNAVGGNGVYEFYGKRLVHLLPQPVKLHLQHIRVRVFIITPDGILHLLFADHIR